MNKRGFTLIELMIVVVIIGLLAALAIPRFQSSVTKTKVVEAKQVLKQIYQASNSYYEAHGQYPALHTFNDASNKETASDWDPIPDLVVHAPSGQPRFSYEVTIGGTDGFEITADPTNSWDANLHKISPMKIDDGGNITGGLD
ncbi:MAG: type IV pilin protein [Candidatus Zixiibacteriota bacterium]